ncbi:uncharacterized protein LOC143513747 [Brachyhypopomus gauderio]|uniref:uncharacterized protein LOC143513747 n=1 Tax=Brachyhypopomus gauderio TaxID=698409 RepID=UPI004042FB31
MTCTNDGYENYDDVITADQNSADVTEEMTEIYDDVITTGLSPDIIARTIFNMTTPEDCDIAGSNPKNDSNGASENSDVISAGQDVGGVDDYEDIKEEPEKEINHVTERPRPMPFLRKLHLNFFKLNK